jgi:hypothetical protein
MSRPYTSRAGAFALRVAAGADLDPPSKVAAKFMFADVVEPLCAID